MGVCVNVCDIDSSLHFLKPTSSASHYPLCLKSPHLCLSSLLSPPCATSRLEQGVSLGGCLGRERRVLQRRGPHELWPRGRHREEAGESEPEEVHIQWTGVVYLSDSFWALTDHLWWPFDPPGSRKVYGGDGLREGGTSGAVRQEWRHGPANQRRRGWTVVRTFISEVTEKSLFSFTTFVQ